MCFVVLCVSGVFLERPTHLLLALAVCCFIGAITPVIGNLRRFAPLIVFFFLMTIVLWSVFRAGGQPLFEWHFVRVSRESLEFGVAMGIRLVSLTILGLTFLTVTSVEDFSAGAQSLGMGYRASFALSLSFRLVPLFFNSVETVVLAQKSRGFDLSHAGPLAKLRGYPPLFVPIISQGLRDADGLAMAVECRGFGAGRRTALEPAIWRGRDSLAMALTVVALALSIYMRVRG